MSAPADGLIERADDILAERSTHQGTWDQISRYVIPSRPVFQEGADGGARRERMVLDSTAPYSLILFASFLHTTLSNPADRWFYIEPVDRDLLNVDPAIKRWAEDTETGINTAFSVGETTVYDTLHSVNLDLGAFGWSCFYTGVRRGRFWTKHIGIRDAAIAEGPEGSVDTVVVTERMSLLSARKRWPGRSLGDRLDRIPPERAAKETIECLHIAFPEDDAGLVEYLPPEVRRVARPFYAAWVCRDTRHVIAADWHDHLPYVCPRWAKMAGSPYAIAPAMTALGDILMLNRMNETTLRGAEKLVDPPLLIPEGATISPVRLFPGGLTYTDGDVKANPLIPPGASRIELGFELIRQRQEAVRNAFFVPLFLNADQPVKTATQVLQEADERNRAAAPMVSRLHHELFNPLVTRAWSLLLRLGQLPPPPPGLLERGGARVGYRNPILASQRQLSGLAAMRWFESLAPWGQVDPGVFDWADPDQVARLLHQASGAPAHMLRDQRSVEGLRRARQAAEQAQVDTANTLAGVEATAKLIAAQKGAR